MKDLFKINNKIFLTILFLHASMTLATNLETKNMETYECILLLTSLDPDNSEIQKSTEVQNCQALIEQAFSDFSIPEIKSDIEKEPINYKEGIAHFDRKKPLHSIHAFLSQSLCFQCHEMKPLIDDYLQSSHFKNESSEITNCGSCHIKPGLLNEVKAKANGAIELLIHASGKYDKEKSYLKFISKFIQFNLNMFNSEVQGEGVIPIEKRSEMSQHVLTDIAENDSIVCMRCHGTFEYKKKEFDSQKAFARKKHATAMKNRRKLIQDLKTEGPEISSDNIGIDELKNAHKLIERRQDILNPTEDEKITCIDCHKYPTHKKPTSY